MTITKAYRAISKHNRQTAKEDLLCFLDTPYVYSPMPKYRDARKFVTRIGLFFFLLIIVFASIGIVQNDDPDDVNAYTVSLMVSFIGMLHLHWSTKYVTRLDPILQIQDSVEITERELWTKQCIYDIRKLHVLGIYTASMYSFFLFITVQLSLFTDPNRDAILPMFVSLPILSLSMSLSTIVHLYIWFSHSVVPDTDVNVSHSGILLSLVSIIEFVSAIAIGASYVDGT